MWKITALDYSAAQFTSPEARLVAGISEAAEAKWRHRGIITATRPGRGDRGGHLYSALKIFELKVLNMLVEEVTIPPSEAKQIAQLTANGKWKTHVISDRPPPLDVFLIFSFSKAENCWTYDLAGPSVADSFKSNASLVVAAGRELTAVSKHCWKILNEPSRIPW
jgi:hypothetical protein